MRNTLHSLKICSQDSEWVQVVLLRQRQLPRLVPPLLLPPQELPLYQEDHLPLHLRQQSLALPLLLYRNSEEEILKIEEHFSDRFREDSGFAKLPPSTRVDLQSVEQSSETLLLQFKLMSLLLASQLLLPPASRLLLLLPLPNLKLTNNFRNPSLFLNLNLFKKTKFRKLFPLSPMKIRLQLSIKPRVSSSTRNLFNYLSLTVTLIFSSSHEINLYLRGSTR